MPITQKLAPIYSEYSDGNREKLNKDMPNIALTTIISSIIINSNIVT